MPKPVKILSIDGGGIRGIIAARVIQEIETLIKKPLGQAFDLIAGTSTGGIIACGLARPKTPMSAKELLDLYVNQGTAIFHRSLWKVVSSVGGVVDEKYPVEPLEQILADLLQDTKLSDIEKTRLLVTSYAIELPPSARSAAVPDSTRAPYFFKSWNVADPNQPLLPTSDFHLRDVARATSAAPTYFEPASIQNLGGARAVMIDGGVVANNPAMCAYAEAIRLWPQSEVVVVSIGTGELERDIPYRDAKNWGLVEWARPILSVLMDGSCDTVNYELGRILQDDYFRFDISLGTHSDPKAAYDDMDNVSSENIGLLLGRAEMMLCDPVVSQKIQQVIKVLL